MSPTGRINRGGPQLPYDLLAGIVPCPGGWLVLGAKLQGITMAPQAPEVFRRFIDLLDYRPSFAVMALHLPLGLPAKRHPGGRTCDVQARRLLGWPRATAVSSPPSRQELADWILGTRASSGMSVVTRALMPRIVEVYEHLSSYHQRTLFEVHPELSFHQMNDDRSLRYSKHTLGGREERREILRRRIPGIDRALDVELPRVRLTHVMDASAALWTARRILARAVYRLPEDPEWDDDGIRMELVR